MAWKTVFRMNADWELAERNAWRKTFDEPLDGCLFHFGQANWRRVQQIGHEMIKKYIDAMIKKIEEHNQRLLDAIQKETFSLREGTRGSGVVICPECNEEFYWGSLMHHRTRTCKNCRV